MKNIITKTSTSLKEKFLANCQNSQGTSWLKRNNEKTEKKNTLRKCQPPACQKVQVATTDRSGRTQCQAKKTGNIKQTVARARQEHEEEKGQYGLPQRVGAKRPWCLGSEEPSVPSYAGQNDVKASVDNTCRKLRFFSLH